MNSCRSIEFCACAPPLITFIIGTGSVRAPLAAQVAVERDAARRPRGLRGGERDAEDRVGAEPALVRRAVAARSARASTPAWSARVPAGDGRAASSPFTFATAVRRRPCRPTRRRRRAARPPRGRRWRRRTERLPGRARPDSSRTSTSTVGFPRESRTEAAPDVARSDSCRSFRPLEPSILLGQRRARPRRRRRPRRGAPPARRGPGSAPSRPRSSSSGSAFSRRATLTQANSTSPSSAATRGSGSCSAAGLGRDLGRAARTAPRRGRRARRRRRGSRSRLPPRGVGPFGAQEQRRQVLGHVVEDAVAALLLDLEPLPVLAHAAGRVRLRVAEDVRMARDELRVDAAGDLPRDRRARARTGAARGSRSGRAGRRARRAASRRRRRARRRRPRRPPRPCAARSSAPSARGPTGSRGAGARSALELDQRVVKRGRLRGHSSSRCSPWT